MKGDAGKKINLQDSRSYEKDTHARTIPHMRLNKINDGKTVIFNHNMLRKLARWLEMSSPGVGYSVERGEAIVRENGYRLID